MEINTAAKLKPVTALYLRISLDDDNQDISNSVANQRDLLNAYVAADPVLSAGEVLTFADDGWSGTNFERPQVKALLDLVRRGSVQNIVVKDLSRWGRNYPEVNKYLDQIFPFLGVRFISVNDQYDSETHKWQTAPMSVAFSSIVHDIYSKELAVKVKQAHTAKALKGEYVAGTVPYGFLRSETEKNRLVIDEVAAITVRRIFDLACEGLSGAKIAAVLNTDGVDSPLEHRRRYGRSTLALRPKAERCFWDGSVILRMLDDERYIGTMVYAKTKNTSRNASSSGKRAIYRPEAEWIRTPGAHDAIITAEQFEQAKASRRKNIRGASSVNTADREHRSPFVGKVVCGYCGRTLTLSATNRPFFRCLTVKRKTDQGCYDGKIYISEIEKVLLAAVKIEAQKALIVRDDQRQSRQAQKSGSDERDMILSELKKLTANSTLLEKRGILLYEEFADGKIDKEAYVTAKTANSVNLTRTQNLITKFKKRLDDIDSKSENTAKSSSVGESVLHRVLDTVEVTDEVLSLIDRITVFERGRIEIRFVFADSLSNISQ